jgi:hypothetical protein
VKSTTPPGGGGAAASAHDRREASPPAHDPEARLSDDPEVVVCAALWLSGRRGEWLEVAPDGTVWLQPSGYIPGKRAIDRLVADEHVTRPVPAAPLFGLPAEPGAITKVGRVALDWALHGESAND